MLKNLIVAWVAGLMAQLPAAAHDFWLQPEAFDHPAGSTVGVSILVGHGAETSPWPSFQHRVIAFRSIGPNGTKDHRSGISPGGTGEAVLAPLETGAHIVYLESTNSFSELSADRFDGYVEEEGILPIAIHRASADKKSIPGRELYSRRGKTLIQVGTGSADQTHIISPIGLTLEIVPNQNPFQHDPSEPFSVSVLYNGQPIENATLHITQLGSPENTLTARTSSDGQATLESLPAGDWLFHTVWAEPVDGLLNGAEYSTVFSSLTFSVGCNK
ncbi:MAG: DUF4198 domain-containing protein [Henriciella sp.]